MTQLRSFLCQSLRSIVTQKCSPQYVQVSLALCVMETPVSKSTATYWNTLSAENAHKWESIEGSDGMLEQLTVAMDSITGDYTRLTRFKAIWW